MRPPSNVPDLPDPGSEPTVPRQGTPQGPQVPHSLTPLAPGHQQVTQQESCAERFPTPEAYLQFRQQQAQKQPVVQYVADANNPFSDNFQQLQQLQRPEKEHTKGAATKGRGASKAHVKAASETAAPPTADTTPTLCQTALPQQQPSVDSPRCISSANQKGEGERNDVSTAAPPQEPFERIGESQRAPRNDDKNQGTPVESHSNGSPSQESSLPTAVARGEDEQAENEPTDSTAEQAPSILNKPTSGLPGLGGALQRLESMVADIAHEEEVCKELEKCPESERREFDFNDIANFDLYEQDGTETNFEDDVLCPSKSESAVSLECHEETVASPLLEATKNLDRTSRMRLLEENLPEKRLLAACENKKALVLPKEMCTEYTSSVVNSSGLQVTANREEQQLPVENCAGSSLSGKPSETENVPCNQQDNMAAQKDTALKRSDPINEPAVVPVIRDLNPELPRPTLSANDHHVLPYQPRGQTDLCPPCPQSDLPAHTEIHQLYGHGQQLPEASMSIPLQDVSDTAAHVQQPGKRVSTGPISRHKLSAPVKPRSQKGKRPKVQVRSVEGRDDLTKKELHELKRQEYERKKREYEEQQMKKRMLQKQLRIQKQLLKEEKRRQRILLSPVRNKSKGSEEEKTNARLTNEISKPAASLALCEPKLLLTHALVHPCGSTPFNGQCPVKGVFGNAKVDGVLDYYKHFPSPEVDGVHGHPLTPPSSLPPSPGSQLVHTGMKSLMNGDVSPHRKAELLELPMRGLEQREEAPCKRARYMEIQESGIEGTASRGNINILTSMPTPPLSDNTNLGTDNLTETTATRRDPHPVSTRSSSTNSLTSLPDNVQYIASSSPESDALNRVGLPKFPALNVDRECTESPTFPPATATVKRERLGSLESCPSSCCGVGYSARSTAAVRTSAEYTAACRTAPLTLEPDSDDLDNINVTLTLSPNSEQRVTDTVASVADLIGCSPPRPSDIVIEPSWKTTSKDVSNSPMEKNRSKTSKSPYPYSQFNMNSTGGSAKKPDGPYCRHCDVLVIGIGIARAPDDATNDADGGTKSVMDVKTSDSKSSEYKIHSVNVAAGEWLGDIFCSEDCLKQYHAHLSSESSSAVDECETSLVGSVSRGTIGQTSAGSSTPLEGSDVRGNVVANGLSPTSLLRRKQSWKEEQVSDGVS